MAAKYNITIEQGADFTLDIQLKNADGSEINLAEGGTAVTIDSSGDSTKLKANIKRTPETDNIKDTSNAAITFKFELLAVQGEDTNTGNAGASGRLRLKMADTITKQLPPDNLKYDLFRSDGTSWFKDLEGNITIAEQISVPV